MRPDADALKRAVALAVVARRIVDAAYRALGRPRPTLADLRRLSPEFRQFERLAPDGWLALIDRAAAGDDRAIEQLERACEAWASRTIH